MFSSLFDRFWEDGINLFGSPSQLRKYLKEKEKEYEDLETETCEFVRGDYKTTIVCKFNKKGYMVSHTTYTENISQPSAVMSNLKQELMKAIEDERYEEVSGIQEKINKLREQQEQTKKPTL